MPTVPSSPAGISQANRHLLELLHQKAEGPFSAIDAAGFLGSDIAEARRLLGYLARRGWLARVRQGLYVPVPLESRHPGEWHEDSWVVAAKSLSPCYIGGWSACEHWGLTEQLFRTVVVVTARRVRHRRLDLQGTPFWIRVLPKEKLFGTRPVWRGRVRVAVSDPSRTLVDILDDPALGGGIRHVADIVAEYVTGEMRDAGLLVEYAERIGNRTVFKRLGHILEALAIDDPELLDACRERVSTGLTKLDPAVSAPGRIVRRWGLRVNVELGRAVVA